MNDIAQGTPQAPTAEEVLRRLLETHEQCTASGCAYKTAADFIESQSAEIQRLQGQLEIQTKAANHWFKEAQCDHNDLVRLLNLRVERHEYEKAIADKAEALEHYSRVRVQLAEARSALREIRTRLESASAEVDCFNVYEARDVARDALAEREQQELSR